MPPPDKPDKPVAEIPRERTVVYKDSDNKWSFVHLNADGDPWVHGFSPVQETREAAEALAAAAFPGWPVEKVNDNPWTEWVDKEKPKPKAE